MKMKGGDGFRNWVEGVIKGEQVAGRLIPHNLQLQNGKGSQPPEHPGSDVGEFQNNQVATCWRRWKGAGLFSQPLRRREVT